MVNNAYGRHSFYDLDESWYRYMKADREERKKMCESCIEVEAIVVGIGAVLFVIGGIIALCKGVF